MANPDYIVECDNLVKIYKTRDIEVLALQGLELSVRRGELMAIIGNSGSGKSTFLNMLGALDRPNAGRLFVDGKNLFKMSEKELVEYKRSTVGFVWQNNARNLLPWLPAWQNVQTPMLFGSAKDRKKRAMELLELVGMEHKAHSRLSQLSGGEQQRIAIAIALANNPKLLLADEPTGSVDSKTAGYIFDVFRRLNRELGLTIIIVTHDRALAQRVNRVVAIRDGKTASEMVMTEDFRRRLEQSGGFQDMTPRTLPALRRNSPCWTGRAGCRFPGRCWKRPAWKAAGCACTPRTRKSLSKKNNPRFRPRPRAPAGTVLILSFICCICIAFTPFLAYNVRNYIDFYRWNSQGRNPNAPFEKTQGYCLYCLRCWRARFPPREKASPATPPKTP